MEQLFWELQRKFQDLVTPSLFLYSSPMPDVKNCCITSHHMVGAERATPGKTDSELYLVVSESITAESSKYMWLEGSRPYLNDTSSI